MVEWLNELQRINNWYGMVVLLSGALFGLLTTASFTVRWMTGHAIKGRWFPSRGTGEGGLTVGALFGVIGASILWPLGWAIVGGLVLGGAVWGFRRMPQLIGEARQAKLQRRRDAKFRELTAQVEFWKGLLSEENTDPSSRSAVLDVLRDLHKDMAELS